MKYDVTKGGYILLGRCGENLARTVEIDVSEYLKEYPGAAVTLLHRRHGESDIYPVAAELRDGCLVWQPTSADTAIAGSGEAEVRVTVDGVLAKSKILSTMVDKSLTGQETDAPEPGMDWVDKITTAIGSVQNMKAEAESVAYGEPASAEYDGKTGTMHFGIPEGRPGRDGTDGKDGAAGAKGDKGDPGSDASVTAENIQSALGYAPVRDVQVAGNSVMDGGVANVPVADTDILGVIKAGHVTESGIWFANGVPRISFATDDEISSRNGQRKAIVCNNLDKAVKAAMCDGKGAAWTSAEQKAARDRMGVDKAYELIEEITLTEDTAIILRTTEPDGTLYKFKSVVIFVETSSSVASSWVDNYIISDAGDKIYYGFTTISKDNHLMAFMFEVYGGFLRGFGQGASSSIGLRNSTFGITKNPVVNYITSLRFVSYKANTVIRIYGVRA